jgi:RNA polymerase sigma-70 factor (family 1)
MQKRRSFGAAVLLHGTALPLGRNLKGRTTRSLGRIFKRAAYYFHLHRMSTGPGPADEMADVAQGPPSGLEQLFRQYYARLAHFSYQITGHREGAEDIAQEAFISYWHQQQEVAADEAAVKAFLYSTVRNASLNAVRHTKVVQLHQSQTQATPPVPETEPDVLRALIRAEVVAEIYEALEALPAGCRTIVQMGYLDDKKNHEIAAELGISVNTVKTQKQRGLQLLRLRLRPETLLALLLLAQEAGKMQ